MADPMPEKRIPLDEGYGGSEYRTLVAHEDWSVSEASHTDGRPALVVRASPTGLERSKDAGVLADEVLIFDSVGSRNSYLVKWGWAPPGQDSTLGHSRLLGYLAFRRSEVFIQAEVMATLSLGWVASRSPRASSALAQLCGVDAVLIWQAEDRLYGGSGRPDLVGRSSPGGPPSVVIEAKLGAPVNELQLNDYARSSGQLVFLLPRARRRKAVFMLEEWSISAKVLAWEDVFEALRSATADDTAASAELEQLIDLYRVKESSWIRPFTEAELADPTQRVDDLARLINEVASELNSIYGHDRGMYLFRRPGVDPRRYVMFSEPWGSNVALRVFLSPPDPLGSRVGLMMSRATPHGTELIAHWVDNDVPVVEAGSEAYVAIRVPTEVDQGEMVASCVAQARGLIDLLLRAPIVDSPNGP